MGFFDFLEILGEPDHECGGFFGFDHDDGSTTFYDSFGNLDCSVDTSLANEFPGIHYND